MKISVSVHGAFYRNFFQAHWTVDLVGLSVGSILFISIAEN